MSKKNLTIAIALAAVLAAMAYYWLAMSGPDPIAMPGASDDPLADQLARENRAALRSAPQAEFIAVPPFTADDHLRGPMDAPAKVIVYSDFECEFCGELNQALNRLRAEFPEQAAVAFRHYPLRSHANAYEAALASECAAEQGRFWEMHDALYAANDSGVLGAAAYAELAKGLSLDSRGFQDCLDSRKYADKVQDQAGEADVAGVSGVPALFINNRPYAGALPYEDFTDSQGFKRDGLRTIIERELAGA